MCTPWQQAFHAARMSRSRFLLCSLPWHFTMSAHPGRSPCMVASISEIVPMPPVCRGELHCAYAFSPCSLECSICHDSSVYAQHVAATNSHIPVLGCIRFMPRCVLCSHVSMHSDALAPLHKAFLVFVLQPSRSSSMFVEICRRVRAAAFSTKAVVFAISRKKLALVFGRGFQCRNEYVLWWCEAMLDA